uniref:Uncharacterized protein n=1 Tax=Romanomermis culicivorax TaxID=13658 RepID=A0A915HQA4_ROMCU
MWKIFRNSKDGWYKQGFQVEYPSDCHLSRLDEDPVPTPQLPPRRPPPVKQRIIDRPLPLPAKDYGIYSNTAKDYCNIKSPTLAHFHRYRNKIESVDEISSTYSCDAEGYYTSMHKDSGLSSKKGLMAKPANLHKLCANSSAANGNYEALDNWLLAKFRAELALNNLNDKHDSRSFTLPRKNVRFSE